MSGRERKDAVRLMERGREIVRVRAAQPDKHDLAVSAMSAAGLSVDTIARTVGLPVGEVSERLVRWAPGSRSDAWLAERTGWSLQLVKLAREARA